MALYHGTVGEIDIKRAQAARAELRGLITATIISRLVYHLSQFAVTIKKIISFLSRYWLTKTGASGDRDPGPLGRSFSQQYRAIKLIIFLMVTAN